MSDKRGILSMQSSGRWAIRRPGRDPHEITSGEVFRIEVVGEMRVTRMERRRRALAELKRHIVRMKGCPRSGGDDAARRARARHAVDGGHGAQA
jgi:hypothetical protein